MQYQDKKKKLEVKRNRRQIEKTSIGSENEKKKYLQKKEEEETSGDLQEERDEGEKVVRIFKGVR